MNDIMQKLQAPFPITDIEFRVGSTTQDKKKGLALAYITNRAIMNRLDELFGVDGWKNEYKEMHQGILCGISLKINNEWVTKWDGADLTNIEATKGGLSDSMKRAAVQWGIGRYLYKLPDFWVEIKQQGRSYVIAKKPTLPNWALPGGKVENITQKQLGEIKTKVQEFRQYKNVSERDIYLELKISDLMQLTHEEAEEAKTTLNKWITAYRKKAQKEGA